MEKMQKGKLYSFKIKSNIKTIYNIFLIHSKCGKI